MDEEVIQEGELAGLTIEEVYEVADLLAILYEDD